MASASRGEIKGEERGIKVKKGGSGATFLPTPGGLLCSEGEKR